MHQTNESQNQAYVAILIFNKVDFEAKLCRRDQEYQYILIQMFIHEGILIENASIVRAINFVAQTLMGIKFRQLLIQ